MRALNFFTLALLVAGCGSGQSNPTIRVPIEKASSSVLSPSQPLETTDPSMTWKQVPNTELFSKGGPQYRDVNQGYVEGDCTFLSALSGLAAARPHHIVGRTHFLGRSPAGAKVYKIHLTDLAGHDQMIVVDDQVLENKAGAQRVDRMFTDPDTAKVIMWPTLWQKAAAKLFKSYEKMPPNLEIELRVLTGHDVRHADIIEVTPESAAAADAIVAKAGRGQVMTAGSMPSADFATKTRGTLDGVIGFETDQSNTWLVTQTTDGNFAIVMQHAYTVLSVTGSTVTVRNPWGVNFGGDKNGVLTFPRSLFPILFTQVALEVEPS